MTAFRLTILLTVGAGITGVIYLRGRGEPLAPVHGLVRDLTVTPRGLLWIDAPAEPGKSQARLWHLPSVGQEPVCLLQAYDLRALAVCDDRLYVLAEKGPQEDAGVLIVADLAQGTQSVVEGLHCPQGLTATPDSVYWTESRAARAAGIVHIPIMGPVQAIRCGDLGGGHPVSVALAEASDRHFAGSLLGVRGGRLYWTEIIGGSCTLIKRGMPGGDQELLARETGVNVATLTGSALYWTAPSRELDLPQSGRCVKRLDLQASEPTVVTDWLASRQALFSSGSTIYSAGDGWLWRVPERLGPPVPILQTTAQMSGQVAVDSGNLYCVDSWRKQPGLRIIRYPFSLGGYIRAALGLRKARPLMRLSLGGDAG